MVRFGSRTALVVVDVQNDFADPAGSLYVAGGDTVVGVVNRFVRRARLARRPVFYTQDWHPPTTPHFAKDGGVWPVHCVAGTWGAQLHPDLVVDGEVVRKGEDGGDGYSGFTVRDPLGEEVAPTALDAHLRAAGVGSVVVVGIAGEVCVKATALDALRLGYRTAVVRAATASVNLQPGDDDAAFTELAAAGVRVE
jgi:nicotinamidase/pyrazinamidase